LTENIGALVVSLRHQQKVINIDIQQHRGDWRATLGVDSVSVQGSLAFTLDGNRIGRGCHSDCLWMMSCVADPREVDAQAVICKKVVGSCCQDSEVVCGPDGMDRFKFKHRFEKAKKDLEKDGSACLCLTPISWIDWALPRNYSLERLHCLVDFFPRHEKRANLSEFIIMDVIVNYCLVKGICRC
jgi:hypothetical protein